MSSTTVFEEEKRQNMHRLLAFIHNPTCTRLCSQLSSLPISDSSQRWRPRLRFLQWARQHPHLVAGFSAWFPSTSLQKVDPTTTKTEGMYSLNHPLVFSTQTMSFPILADAIIMHNDMEKIVEFCCQPERGGNTNRFALQRSRLRAAIHSYALNPQKPQQTAFLVLHQWKNITILEQSIHHEIEQIQEALESYPQESAQEYVFLDTCRWFCPHSYTCREAAQKEGHPIAWSLALQNIIASDVWSAQQQDNQLHVIASFYHRAFSEDT